MVSIDVSQLIGKLWEFFQRNRSTKKATKDYLNTCINETHQLGGDWVHDNSFLLETERAFVPMSLANSMNGRTERMAKVLDRHQQLVIQGQPGGGKSTLVQYITLIMAKASLHPKKHGHLPRQHLAIPTLFPLRVELKQCNDKNVYDVMLHAILGLPEGYIEKRLEQGHVLTLFDGLDEVADSQRRIEVMQEICQITARLKASHATNCFLVTTRTASYNHRILAGCGYALYTLQELTPDQQKQMIHRYYRLWSEREELGSESENWSLQADDLIQQITNNPAYGEPASNPLLLSQIAALHFQGKVLPSKRYELYKECIDLLVCRRHPHLRDQPQDMKKRMILLGEIALKFHQQGQPDTLPHHEIIGFLTDIISRRPNVALAISNVELLLEKIEQEWGILVNHSNQRGQNAYYSFISPRFQEYLTAYIVNLYPNDYWPILKANLLDDSWQKILLLYTAIPAPLHQVSPLEQVVNELINSSLAPHVLWLEVGRHLANEANHTSQSQSHKKTVDHLKMQSRGDNVENVEALEVLCQIEPDGREFVLDRILGREDPISQQQVLKLLGRMRDPNGRHYLRQTLIRRLEERPRISERISLAQALAQVGDPRLGQLVKCQDFRISKYLVTNVEYARFIEERGREAPRHWTGNQYPLLQANHPVTHISLADALAYCEWLSEKEESKYRLPTEEEWIKVAEEDNPAACFPWGNQLRNDYFNWRGQQHSTTPVGIYLEGNTNQGIADLLGNVWEWTLTRLGHNCVLKGVAWDTTDEMGRQGIDACLTQPDSTRAENIGFRVVAE